MSDSVSSDAELQASAERVIDDAESQFVREIHGKWVETSPKVDRFSTWLMAATGAIAAVLVTQIASVSPYLGPIGFRVCLGCVAASTALGVVAKYYATRCEVQAAYVKGMDERIESFQREMQDSLRPLEEEAEKMGIVLTAQFNDVRVREKLLRPFPNLIRWRMSDSLKRFQSNGGTVFDLMTRSFILQSRITVWQMFLFLLFLIFAVVFARSPNSALGA